jgi:putative DNA primase/helicase
MMALCFIKRYIIQKGYVMYGNGSNGKSTLLSILRMILGTQNTSSIPMQSFQKSQFIGFEIRGKSANISADGGTEPINKTGFLKSILGGDAIRCEQKYQNPFDFIPFVTMIFTFNDLPPVYDDSDGFARKIQTIHFDQRFYGEKRDSSVEKIAYDSDEKSGIFNLLMIIGSRLLQLRKLRYESSVQETKQVWLLRSDSFFKFRTENIVIGTKYRVTREKIEEQYNNFCTENGMTPLSSTRLFSKLKEITGEGPQPTKNNEGKTVRMWHGFTMSSELLEVNQTVL